MHCSHRERNKNGKEYEYAPPGWLKSIRVGVPVSTLEYQVKAKKSR
jgi:hypothetical protein